MHKFSVDSLFFCYLEAFLEEALSANSSCIRTPKSSSVKRKRLRTVPTTADRILDAPETVDDFCKLQSFL